MAHAPSLVHIGLPKTATTALQNHFFPNLDLPYVRYEGSWGKAIRLALDYEPKPVGTRAITSGEQFSAQGVVGSEVIASRLHKMFGDGIVLMVVRRPHDHFVSYYRQMVISMLERFADKRQAEIAAGIPAANLGYVTHMTSINEYFDQNLDGNLRMRPGQGPALENSYFSWMDLDKSLAAFRAHFEIMVIDFELIQTDFNRFSERVCNRMDIPVFKGTLPPDNVSSPQRLNDLLARMPADIVHPSFKAILCEQYDQPKLSEDRQHFLAAFTNVRCAQTFAAARATA